MVAIIGVLVWLLVPYVRRVMENAHQQKGHKCLQGIAQAYNKYINDDLDGRRTIHPGDITQSNGEADYAQDGVQWAVVLARRGYLNDPNKYCFSGDNQTSVVEQNTIVKEGEPSATSTDAWTRIDGQELEFSVYLVAGVPANAPFSTTPIAFSRGIPVDGKWPGKEGVYGAKGGWIAFLDGHVDWFDNLGTEEEGLLVKWNGGKTNDIRETLPSTCVILSASGIVAQGIGDRTKEATDVDESEGEHEAEPDFEGHGEDAPEAA